MSDRRTPDLDPFTLRWLADDAETQAGAAEREQDRHRQNRDENYRIGHTVGAESCHANAERFRLRAQDLRDEARRLRALATRMEKRRGGGA